MPGLLKSTIDLDTRSAWQRSPYGVTVASASQTSASAHPWPADKVLDIEDVLAHGADQLHSIARRVFRSLPSNPHTRVLDIPMGQLGPAMDVPQNAILNILAAALAHYEQHLTERQRQAFAFYREGYATGDTPGPYAARKMGIHVRNVYRLLERGRGVLLDAAAISVYRSRYRVDDWQPSPRQVKAMVRLRPRPCAYCSKPTHDGHTPLCFDCHSSLGSLRPEAWPERTRVWLKPEVERLEREHRLSAIDELFRQHAASMNTLTVLDSH